MTRQYDGVRPVVEGTLAGDTWTTTARNVWEGATYYSPLVLRLLPSGGYNYLADGLGSTRQLMRNSDHAITDTYTYDAFGNTLASTGTTDNPYRYVGGLGYYASTSGALQLGARFYEPCRGTLMQSDPLSPHRLHDYRYAYDRPTRAHDPSGRITTIGGLGLGCVTGGFLGGLSAAIGGKGGRMALCMAGADCVLGALAGAITSTWPGAASGCVTGLVSGPANYGATAMCEQITGCPHDDMDWKCLVAGMVIDTAIGCMTGLAAGGDELEDELEDWLVGVVSNLVGLDFSTGCSRRK